MDNLTHSLVGALMGRMGLKRLTPRAMPALILSANLPDIDSFVAPLWGEDPIAAHRGFTHGIGGLATMPILAAASSTSPSVTAVAIGWPTARYWHMTFLF